MRITQVRKTHRNPRALLTALEEGLHAQADAEEGPVSPNVLAQLLCVSFPVQHLNRSRAWNGE